MFHSTPGWWRPLLWAGLLTLALIAVWQAATSGMLLAADAIALSEPWRFVDESKPGTPPIGGELAAATTDAPSHVAARFNINSTMQAVALQLSDADLGGVPLAQVEELGYCTRLVDGPRPYAVTLQINIDADVTDGDESWQGRLVFTPSYNGAVIQGEWQCWNTLVGKWWATGGPLAAKAPVDNPQPLDTLLAHFPNVGINGSYSVVALKAGDGWEYFQGEASPVVIGLGGERINIVFGTAPQENSPEDSLGDEILLPVLFNQPALQNNGGNRNQGNNNKDGKDEKKESKKENWSEVNWADFDWNQIEWEKVDWEHLDWGAFGWSDERVEALRAFVEDVKGCKGKGWQEMGFHDAGACVAYYVQAHTPSDVNWDDFEWGRNNRSHRERGGDD
jgi:hypothetical protein